MVVGIIGGFITCVVMPALDKIHIDDPVGAAATHGVFINMPNQIFIHFFTAIIKMSALKYRCKWYLGSCSNRLIC
jgi:ammonia channel protein AmtB